MEEKQEIYVQEKISDEILNENSQDENIGEFLADKPQIIYHISDFDGPIELLYQLITDAKIEIEDIFISDITSQYVEIIKNTPHDELDYEYASEFIKMAADLVYLKSYRTLPQEDEDLDENDPYYEQQQLINKIKEYALFKEKSEKLREMETINRFYRTPTYTDKDFRIALINFSMPKLVEAFAHILSNIDVKAKEIIPKTVKKDRFSVNDQMSYIRDVISRRKTMPFTELFLPSYDKGDMVITFLAVLELLKYGKLTATQDESFGEITISMVEGTENDTIDFNEDEYGQQK